MMYPDLSKASLISIDTETYDPYLLEQGPGFFRRDGYVVGISIATDDGFSEYYGIRHNDTSTSDREKNIRYIKDVLSLNTPIIGTNIGYDIGWLSDFLGIKINNKLNDIQIAEPLLDAYQQRYSLDFQAQKYLGEHKLNDEMKEWCDSRGLKGDVRTHIYKMPYSLVRKYAIGDVKQPLEIFKKQQVLLEQESLLPIYELETDLLRPILDMRRNGIRIDRKKISSTVDRLTENSNKWRKELYNKYGEFNVNSSQEIARVLDRLGVSYPLTEKKHPNIDHKYLEFYCNHEIAADILKLRAVDKVIGTFLTGAFIDYSVEDRIHPNFITMKRDDGGAVTGRLSCQNPNLQQVPSKNETYGPECRSAFIPEEGSLYGKIDYSQIEYRVISHYAMGEGGEKIRKEFNENPYTDYHSLVQRWIEDVTGIHLDRKHVKNLNFGTAYFMGVKAMSSKFGWPLEQSVELNKLYFDTFTFLNPTRTEVINVAKMRGYVRTILGRRARVSHAMREERKEYKVWNYLVQGSAADIMKKAIVESYKKGLFNILKPHITVHDELGVSIPKNKEGVEAYKELKHTMENCVKLKVPIIAEAEIGPSWGETEKFEFKDLELSVKGG
jgi:DNA polymerase-1